MKQAKQKHTTTQHFHPSLFSISIFQSPEQFIALYLAIQSPQNLLRQKAARYLQKLLHRTKSAPIALTYTKEFLLVQTESEIQLSIIRFISQLSDLSAGKSMQSSLSFIIDNSSFLTELRHNLTHRVMVKGLVIERGKQMILHELKDKYWKVMFEKVWKIYCIDGNEVLKIFQEIASSKTEQDTNQALINDVTQRMKESKIYGEYERLLLQQTQNRLTHQYLFIQCQSNYEFKSLIKPYIMKKVLPQVLSQLQNSSYEENTIIDSYEINEQIVAKYFDLSTLGNSSNVRLTIMIATVLEIVLSLHKYKHSSECSKYRQILSSITVILLKKLDKNNKQNQQGSKKVSRNQVFSSTIVLKKFRQVYLLNFIQQYKIIIETLPQEVLENIKKFWSQKESTLGKHIFVDF